MLGKLRETTKGEERRREESDVFDVSEGAIRNGETASVETRDRKFVGGERDKSDGESGERAREGRDKILA